MKKLLFALAVAFASVSGSMAQDEVFVKGSKVLNVGVGLGSYQTGSMVIPPIAISGEYGITDALISSTGQGYIGVGGYLAYTSSKESFGYDSHSFDWKYSYLIIGARGAFHYQFVDKLDTYAGVMLGYNIGSVSYSGDGGHGLPKPSVGGFIPSGFAGARYYFSDNLAVYGEVGYGIAALELGLSVKF